MKSINIFILLLFSLDVNGQVFNILDNKQDSSKIINSILGSWEMESVITLYQTNKTDKVLEDKKVILFSKEMSKIFNDTFIHPEYIIELPLNKEVYLKANYGINVQDSFIKAYVIDISSNIVPISIKKYSENDSYTPNSEFLLYDNKIYYDQDGLIYCFSKKNYFKEPSYNERVKKYINQYALLALAEQKKSGIPACITLGQGILETEAGASELMTEANNHFGIKCNSRWSGPTFTHTDDAPDECFKKYTCAAESYQDHSMHLKANPRYQPLFKLSTTDYAAWAVCLKKCGYATNPQYAQRLIKIIEDFNLQEYTYAGMDSTLYLYDNQKEINEIISDTESVMNASKAATPSTSDEIAQDLKQKTVTDTMLDIVFNDSSAEDTSKITMVNGMKAFYAHKGEMLLGYAVKYNIRYPKLLDNNDLKDGPLPYDMYVYLEKKMTTGTHLTHEVAQGENMLLISQAEGIQLKRLAALNMLYPNEEPAVGTVLQLQTQAAKRPDAAAAPIAAHKGNAIDMGNTPQDANEGFIVLNKPVATDTATPVAEAPSAEIAKPVVADAPKPAIAEVSVHKMKEPVKPAEEAKGDADLDELKASLDKAVYADNSKLKTEKAIAPVKKEVAAEPVKAAAVASGPKFYTIKKGETAFSIAKRNNITVDQLYKWNDIDASGIKVGKSIRVKE